MTWLLRLYPAPWRRRYGDEVAAIIRDRGFSFGMAVDLVAGAIDVWLHPSITLAAASAAAAPRTEEKSMLSRLARVGCAGALGPDVTRADHAKAAAVALGGTIVLTLVWMAVRVRTGQNAYVDALSTLAFLAPTVVSLRYTSLKRRPGSVQAIFIGGLLAAVTAILLAAALIAARL